jgi:hypothetical protein
VLWALGACKIIRRGWHGCRFAPAALSIATIVLHHG